MDDVKALMDAINPHVITGEENRSLGFLRADFALAGGNVQEALKLYSTIPQYSSGIDARSSIRITGKIAQARAFIDQHDTDSAEDALNNALDLEPSAKADPNWALTRLDLYRAENQPEKAFLWAKRLLPVITDDSSRATLLYDVADLALPKTDPDLADKCLHELVTKHPYSEETAKARAKWPEKSN